MINYLALTPTVKKAARDAHASFPAHHDVSDTEQTLWVWAFENKNTVDAIVRDTERRANEIIKPVYELMVKAATKFLRGEDGSTYGYSEEDVFYYSTDLIKEILEVIFQHEDWQSFASALDAMPKGNVDPATAGNNIASYVDVKSAVERLPEDQYNAIVWRYKYRYSQEAIGFEMGIGQRTAARVLDRAVSAIQKDLGQRDRSDLRNALTDRSGDPETLAEAASLTERQYNG